jgi:uroporphyrinogen decarboxylase
MGKEFTAGFDRLGRASGGISDRVPVTAQMHEFAMAWTGADGFRFYRDPQMLVSGIISMAADFGFDVPCIGYDVYNIELESLGQPLVFGERASPVADPSAILVQEPEDLSRLAAPEGGTAARMPFVLEVQRLYQEGTGHPPTIQFCAPFSLASLVRGYAGLIQDVYTQPGFAHDLLRFLTEEVIAPWIRVQKETFPGSTLALGADALCSPPMTNRAIIEEFSIPYILRLRELCPVPIAVVNWWGDSCYQPLEEFLELKRRVCVNVIRAQDPDVARLGARVFKEFAVRHGLTLELGVGDSIINTGPVHEIRERIRRYIEEAAPGGRLILYLASLNADTPPAHVRAALDAAREFGVY